MLWDLFWALVDEYGYDPDLLHGESGNNIALQLVMDGLKLQPCRPTFVEARDAILQADLAGYGGALRCLIWTAFARRGPGLNASAGANHNSVTVTASFDRPLDCMVPVLGPPVLSNQIYHVVWSAVSGQVYRVQQTPSLAAPAWSDAASVTAHSDSASHEMPPPSAERYYRILLKAAP